MRDSPESPDGDRFETDVPARLDRLPWSRFHLRVVIALGITWVLDGLEVTLVGSLAARIAEVGRLPLLGTLERTRDEPATSRSNSAQRLRTVAGSLRLPAGLALGGAVALLIDDVVDTGWTITEASRLLRAAGASAVLPLVLAVDG